jgi:ATP phosphoribosyltransferase regulatory subunit
LIQTFDYYTGIVFEAVSVTEDLAHVLGQGGRYDRLLGLYHPQGQDCPGIGFSLDLETCQQVLQTNPAMPHYPPNPDWLVVATTPAVMPAALIYSQKLRSTAEPVRVEMYLGDGEAAQVRHIAIGRHIAQIAWVSTDGIEVEKLA